MGHPASYDPKAFLAHMSACHNTTIVPTQDSVFLSMFEYPNRTLSGACCLCFHEASNLKTHLAHHLEQIALFALPRKNEVAESDSGVKIRGSAKTVSEKNSSNSGSDFLNEQETGSSPGNGDTDMPRDEDTNKDMEAIQQVLVPESNPDDASLSWAQVYQRLGIPDKNSDYTQLKALPSTLDTLPGTQSETLPSQCHY